MVRPSRRGRNRALLTTEVSTGVVDGDDIDWPTGVYQPPSITVEESDGSPSVAAVDTLIFDAADFTVTDNTDGSATITADEPDAAAHIADTTDAHDASAVSIADSGGYFTGTDVEAALQELGAGGGGGGGVTVQDEGTPLTTTATTLDFVGAGVTATGSGATKTITIPGGGSAGLVLLASLTASASASLDFATRNASGQSGAMFQSDFDDYEVRVTGYVPATNNTLPRLRFSTNGGSSYDSGNNYHWNNINKPFSAGAVGGNYVGSTSGIVLFGDSSGNGLSNAGTPSLACTFRIVDPGSTANHKRVVGHGIAAYNGGTVYTFDVGGSYSITTAVDAFQIIMSSGNITTGTIRVYGIAK